jgi:UDP-N-acetylmuramoyl-tripeptide--D-alanyl-D-alanine ligase
MRHWDAERIAAAAGARVVADEGAPGTGPRAASIDTRALAGGELFFGLPGARADGGAHAAQALAAGAWGVLVTPAHARAAAASGHGGVVLEHEDPLAAMQALARAWRRELRARGARVVAVTGSAGKTSTKDILAALLAGALRTAASPANHNTEIGLPLALLAAPAGTEALVLELAMRGSGQIAELTAIAEPDVGVIVNVGPAHLELLGSLEAIAAAKAELIAGLAPGASVVVPADEPLLQPHLRDDVEVLTFGERAGDVSLRERRADGSVVIASAGEEIVLQPSFRQRHNLLNLLAAVAAARALGYTPSGRLEVSFSAMRGQRRELAGAVLVLDDCYNANPMSMHAAIDDLAETARGRRVAVLGDMLELGPDAPRLHGEIGAHAQASGVELLVAVGELAAQMRSGFAGELHAVPDARAAAELVPELVRDGDTVLVKASRGVGLERVTAALAARRAPTPDAHGCAGAVQAANTDGAAGAHGAAGADEAASTGGGTGAHGAAGALDVAGSERR